MFLQNTVMMPLATARYALVALPFGSYVCLEAANDGVDAPARPEAPESSVPFVVGLNSHPTGKGPVALLVRTPQEV